MSQDATSSRYIIRLADAADIPAIRSMQERSFWMLGGDFYTSNEIANFLTLFGTMDDAVVTEGHFFVAVDRRGAILGSGGWTCLRPAYAKAMHANEAATGSPTVRSVFVDPTATRQGIASTIMLHTEQDALQHGVDTLHLTATLSGLALYEALGYQAGEAAELKLSNLSRFRCIKMRKMLDVPTEMKRLRRDFFDRHAVRVARDLIGVQLLVAGVGGIIVETEAYMPDDPASHSFRGRTRRNVAMFDEPGTAYVYRSYGLHWCLNAVCRPGSAVLLRALQPTSGIDVMMARRGTTVPRLLAAGPGRLSQALSIDATHDRSSMLEPPFQLRCAGLDLDVVSGPRIGITQAVAQPWRFGAAGSPFLSRRFP